MIGLQAPVQDVHRPGPLDGVKVVDLTAMLAGPYATMLLADLGADVVKIEPPGGDVTRRSSRIREDDSDEALGGYFQSINRGKRSVMIDLKDPAERDRLLDLVRVADVVVENFSSGVMERLGIGYETLAEINPRLVYATVRGFGDPRTGVSPYTNWPAYDVVAQAMGGFLGITGTADGTPIKSGPGIGDILPATLLAVGILAALHHVQRTGEGQFVDVAMYDAVLSLCERIVYQYSYTGVVPHQQGNTHPLLSPFDILPTADGWVAIAAPHDSQWRTVVALMGKPELGEDPRFITSGARIGNADEVRSILTDWLSTRKTIDVMATLGGKVPIGPVNNVADIFADPHVRARDMLVEIEQPGNDRPVTIAGQPIKFTLTPSRVRGRAPILGEDGFDDVLAGWRSAAER